jgi:hypothetical protein
MPRPGRALRGQDRDCSAALSAGSAAVGSPLEGKGYPSPLPWRTRSRSSSQTSQDIKAIGTRSAPARSRIPTGRAREGGPGGTRAGHA